MTSGRKIGAALLFSVGILWASHVEAIMIDFNSLTHGRIVNTQFLVSDGVSISADNVGGGPDLAVAFDTGTTPTADPDLEGPPWSIGNLAPNTVLGNILIIQENSVGIGDGIADSPDDEGSRPAGSLYFEFNTPINSFGFDLIDVEGVEEYGESSGYFAAFYMDDAELGRVGFGEIVNPANPRDFYDASVEYGNNSANRILPITSAKLGIGFFDKVKINLGGSAGVDNIVASVPEPITLWLFGSGLAGLAIIRRNFKN